MWVHTGFANPELHPINEKIYAIGFKKVYNGRQFLVEPLIHGKSGMKLKIPAVKSNDSGRYRCHLATPNPEIAIYNLQVNSASSVSILMTAVLFIPLFICIRCISWCSQ